MIIDYGYRDELWKHYVEAHGLIHGEDSYFIAHNAFFSAFEDGFARGWLDGDTARVMQIKKALFMDK